MRKEVNILLLILITVGLIAMVYNVSGFIQQNYLALSLSMEYDWYEGEYQDYDCVDRAVITEEYFENEYNIPVYMIYGHIPAPWENESDAFAHVWLVLDIGGRWYEFEPYWYSFTSRQDKYLVDGLDSGFWVDGEEFENPQPYDNWQNLSIVKEE